MNAAFLLLFIAAIASSYSTLQSRYFTDDLHPLRQHVDSLPARERRALLTALSPSLREWNTGMGDNDDELAEDVRKGEGDLLYERFQTHVGQLTVVQGQTLETCGGTGNCLHWVLDSKKRVLLWDSGERLNLLGATHFGLPDIKVTGHISAMQQNLTWYRFDGRLYRKMKCAVRTNDMPPGTGLHTDYAVCGK